MIFNHTLLGKTVFESYAETSNYKLVFPRWVKGISHFWYKQHLVGKQMYARIKVNRQEVFKRRDKNNGFGSNGYIKNVICGISTIERWL
jgi:hypothetical protein